MDVLILNTAVVDLRRVDFKFVDKLVGKGGLAKCETKDMPDYTQEQLHEWISKGFATAGGPGNTAPLIARAGVKIACGVNLGKGQYGGFDSQGKFFYDVLASNGVDMSATHIHPGLPTGTTFIHDIPGGDRGGIAFFPNANNDFDFGIFKKEVERFSPKVVYYMYSGLSERGDANEGWDLAEFIKWCRSRGAVTIVDSHTLTGDPQGIIKSGKPVAAYKLLEPLLGELDVFFTSCDEAKMIENTLGAKRDWTKYDENENDIHFLNFVAGKYWTGSGRARFFGVTVGSGAFEKHAGADGGMSGPNKIESRFMAGEVVDLVGAGDSFRAGLITYVAKNLEDFKAGKMNCEEAVQMGNLFASLYIKAPLNDRYGNIKSYEKMLKVVRAGKAYPSFEALQEALS